MLDNKRKSDYYQIKHYFLKFTIEETPIKTYNSNLMNFHLKMKN